MLRAVHSVVCGSDEAHSHLIYITRDSDQTNGVLVPDSTR